VRGEYYGDGRGAERGRDELPVNIRMALELAASIIRRIADSRLDKAESNGLIGNVQIRRGDSRK